MTEDIEELQTPENPSGNGPVESQDVAPQVENLPESAAVLPTPPVKKRRNKALLAVIIILAALLILVGGGFAGMRAYEANAAKQCQASLNNKQWNQAETICTQALQLEKTNLMANPIPFKMMRGEALFQEGKYDAALADLQAVQAALPQDVRPYQYQAQIYFKQDKLKEALSAGEEVIKRDPQAGFPYMLRAYDAYKQNKYAEALESANAAIQRAPDLELPYRIRGSVLTLQNDLEGALADVNKSLELAPDQPQSLGLRTYIYLMRHEHEKGKQDNEHLQKVALDSSDALFAQALVAMDEYREDEANKLITQAIDKEANSPLFYALRAATYFKSADIPNELADLEQAIKLYPDFPLAIATRSGILFTMYKPVDIEADANRVLTLDPKSVAGHQLLAHKYARDLQWDKGMAEAEKAIHVHPDLTTGYFTRGQLYLSQHMPEKAMADFQKVTELDPQSILGHIGMSAAYLMQHKDEDAMKSVDQAAKIDPDSIPMNVMKAGILLSKKDYINAQKALDEVFKIDPASVDGLPIQAALNLANKDPLKAMSDVDKLGEIMPENPEWMVLRAETYLANNDTDKALSELDKADKINKNIAGLYLARGQAYMLKNFPINAVSRLKAGIALFPADPQLRQLISLAYYQKSDYKDAVTEGKKAIELDDHLYPTYYIMGMSQWNMGDIEGAIENLTKLKGHEKDLDVDQLSSMEKAMDFLKTVPKAVDGHRLIRNDKFNFELNYPISWIPRTPIDKNALYHLEDSNTDGSSMVNIFAFKFDSPVPPGLRSAYIVADILKADLKKLDSYEFIQRDVFEANNTMGYADTFKVMEPDGQGHEQQLKVKEYIFVSSGSYVVILYTAPLPVFDTAVGNADKLVKEFKFTKP